MSIFDNFYEAIRLKQILIHFFQKPLELNVFLIYNLFISILHRLDLLIVIGGYMKKIKNLKYIIILGLLSILFYCAQILIFKKIDQTFFYIFQDLAFFLLEIIMIYFILESTLEEREKKDRIKKLDVVISVYFFESGTKILNTLSKFDVDIEKTKELMNINDSWTDEKFKNVVKILKAQDYSIDSNLYDLEYLKSVLVEQKNYMLLMLQNSSLLEHDYFTDMLWSIFHLLDELVSRETLNNLPDADVLHLSNDIKRAYTTMLVEWVYYSKHLKHTYSYLFSLAERKKPFYDNNVIFKD